MAETQRCKIIFLHELHKRHCLPRHMSTPALNTENIQIYQTISYSISTVLTN